MSANPLIDSTPHFRNDASTVIVFGENLVDLLVDGNGSVEATHGGGPTNVARTIARLGQRVALITGLSSDAFGQGIERRLIDDRVDLDFAVRTSSPTTLAVVEKAAEPPNYVFHISGTAAFLLEREHALDAYRSLASSLGALYVGSLGIVVDPMASALDSSSTKRRRIFLSCWIPTVDQRWCQTSTRTGVDWTTTSLVPTSSK